MRTIPSVSIQESGVLEWFLIFNPQLSQGDIRFSFRKKEDENGSNGSLVRERADRAGEGFYTIRYFFLTSSFFRSSSMVPW